MKTTRNSNQPTKEKSDLLEVIQPIPMKIRTIKLISGIICFLVIGIVLSHAFIETHDSATVAARKDHKAAKSDKNKAAAELLTYVDQFNSGEISQTEFSTITAYLSKQHKQYKATSASKFVILNKAKSDAKILNFTNLNVFSFIFGVFLVLFLLTILFYIYGKPTKHKTLVSSHKRVTVLFMTFSLYYFTWVFYPHSDLPRYLHLTAMFLIGMVLAIAVMSIIDWKFEKKAIISIYKDNFKSLFRFIAITAKDYVDPSKALEYKKEYLKEVDKFELP